MQQTSHEKFLSSYGRLRRKERAGAFMRLYREQRRKATMRQFSWEEMK